MANSSCYVFEFSPLVSADSAAQESYIISLLPFFKATVTDFVEIHFFHSFLLIEPLKIAKILLVASKKGGTCFCQYISPLTLIMR